MKVDWQENSAISFFEAAKIYNVEKKFGLTINKKSISENDLNKIVIKFKKIKRNFGQI